MTESHVHKQTRGWFVPYLIGLDVLKGVGHGRWDYWIRICLTHELPDKPIPYIPFRNSPDEIKIRPFPDRLTEDPVKHVKRMLDQYVYKGYWYDDAWLAFVRYLLHGFGMRGLEEEVDRIPEDVRDFWYTEFNLAYLLIRPIDWSAYILEGGPRWMKTKGAKWSKSTGFFSTPFSVTNMMVAMTFGPYDSDKDQRLLSVCDPCVGTGKMLLAASNYSLRLHGQDIVYDLCLCTMLNGYLWAPWMVVMPDHVREWIRELTGEDKLPRPAPPIVQETDPETVEVATAYRKEQYALFEAAQVEIPPIVEPEPIEVEIVPRPKREVPVLDNQIELF